MHSRRRRIVAPSREARESMTRSSWQPHLGQRITVNHDYTSNGGRHLGNTLDVGQSRIADWRRTPDPVQGFSQRVEEAWPLTLDPSPRAIHVSGPTARGEGRERGHANSNASR